jgi:hypothetical protein
MLARNHIFRMCQAGMPTCIASYPFISWKQCVKSLCNNRLKLSCVLRRLVCRRDKSSRSSGQPKASTLALPTEEEACEYLIQVRSKKVEAIKAFVKVNVMSCVCTPKPQSPQVLCVNATYVWIPRIYQGKCNVYVYAYIYIHIYIYTQKPS